jgi:hypothetical protein
LTKKLLRKSEAAASTSDGDAGYITAPEHKAMETKGIPLAAKITLAQYEELVHRGYDGEVVKRWTQYHAEQELGNFVRRQPKRRIRDLRGTQWRPRHQEASRDASISSTALTVCPFCKTPVRADRLARHVSRVHPGRR